LFAGFTYKVGVVDIVDSRTVSDETCDSACIKIEKPGNPEDLCPNFEATQDISRQPVSMVTSSDAGMVMGLSLHPPLKRAK